MEFTCLWIGVYEWYPDWENGVTTEFTSYNPIALIFELFDICDSVNPGPICEFMDLNLKATWNLHIVGPWCTIVELKNTMSGVTFLVSSLLGAFVVFLIHIMILIISKYSLTLY